MGGSHQIQIAYCIYDPHPGNGNLMAGDSRCYQWWYRDPGAGNPCQGQFFNLSNGVVLVWGA